MSKQTQTVILYPDLQMEFNDSSCIVKCIYNESIIPRKYFNKLNIKKYSPDEINSLKDFYALLNNLNEHSGNQSIEIKKGKKSVYILLLILGFPLLVVPPLGLFFIIFGFLGLIGLIKKTITFPRIKVFSSYSSPENTEILKQLTENNPIFTDSCGKSFNFTFNIEDGEDKVFENIDFDDGSKLLLFAYSVTPNYETHWEHENKDGKPDYRYKNNPSHQEISYYSIKLMVPGKIYYNDYVMKFEYDKIMPLIKKLDKSIKIKNIRLSPI